MKKFIVVFLIALFLFPVCVKAETESKINETKMSRLIMFKKCLTKIYNMI